MGAPSAPAQSNRRAMIMLAVGGGALLLFILITKVLGGGGGDDLSAPITVPPGSGTPRTTVTTGVAPGAPGEAPAPETFEVFSTKNPFTPLVGTPGGGGTGGGGTTVTTSPGGGGTIVTTPPTGTGTGTGTTTGGTGTGTTGGGGTTATTAPPTTGGSATEPRTSQRIALLDVYDQGGKRVANVRVNNTVYEAVAPGQQFATSFQLVSLDGNCGTFLFGDDRFRLCQGEEVLK